MTANALGVSVGSFFFSAFLEVTSLFVCHLNVLQLCDFFTVACMCSLSLLAAGLASQQPAIIYVAWLLQTKLCIILSALCILFSFLSNKYMHYMPCKHFFIH